MSLTSRRVSSSSSRPQSLAVPKSASRRHSKSRHSLDGFDYDPLMASSTSHHVERTIDDGDNAEKPSESIENDPKKMKEAGQLASVFLEIRKGIMIENNVDVSINERIGHERDIKDSSLQAKKQKNISKASLHRAEKVKLMFNLYYFAITESQKSSNPKFVGVDGIYNPLQIIRNRKIRRKYHQTPTISVKTLPLASTAFSNKKDKILWEVSLAELIYDSTWRVQHWYELINAKNELWFPDPDPSRRHHHIHRPHFRHHATDDESLGNIHQKLFEVDTESDTERDSSENNNEESNDNLEVPGKRRRDRLTSKMRSKSPFKRILNSGSSDITPITPDPLLNQDYVAEPSYKSKMLNEIPIEPVKQRIVPHSTTDSSLSSSIALDADGVPYQDSSALNSSSENNEVEQQQQQQLQSQSQPQQQNQQVDLNDGLEDEEYKELKKLNRYMNDLRYANTLMRIGRHDYELKSHAYSNSLKFGKFHSLYKDISTKSDLLNSQILTSYSNALKSHTDELNSIQNELINDYSTRVDKLLTLSDRTIGEVNTTLSLEIRRLTERFEKNSNFTIHKNTDSLLNFAYWLLENLVVLILWSIWVGFSIGRVFKNILRIVWRFLLWFF